MELEEYGDEESKKAEDKGLNLQHCSFFMPHFLYHSCNS